MSTIFFMAVQCSQCSTMQVKQRNTKTKSNKWTCVVCNQNQSIRKVFAQAPMAKHLRSFVQSFNMSRDSQSQCFPPTTTLEYSRDDDSSKRPRSDWTEFLDPDEQRSEATAPGPEIITEMPDRLLKRAKFNPMTGNGDRELRKPVRSKEKEAKEIQELVGGRAASKWSSYVTSDGDEDFSGNGDYLDFEPVKEEKIEDEEIHPDFL